jgi:hypothetical protein
MNPTHEPDDDLRRVLREAVSDVRPQGTLSQIRSRTDKVVPMNRRWLLPSLVSAVVMAVVIGGAYWMTRDDDPTGGLAATPSQTPSGSPSQSAEPTLANRAVPVYFVGAGARGQKLYREFQSQQVCESQQCLLEAATASALSGTPLDPDYSIPWPDGAGLGEASYDGDVLTIDLTGDLHDRPAGMSQDQAQLAIEQLLFSAQAGLGEGRPPVQLLLNGGRTDTVLGVPTSEPLAAANPDDVQALVQIDTPEQGATVGSPVKVTGRAAAFEANVVWEVMVGGDAVVKSGFATAAECCTLAPYEFAVDLEPGTYTLVVHDEDMSGEGRPVNQDTKEFTVQ